MAAFTLPYLCSLSPQKNNPKELKVITVCLALISDVKAKSLKESCRADEAPPEEIIFTPSSKVSPRLFIAQLDNNHKNNKKM